jgi:flavin-dependent dehydrogenase
MSKPWDVIVVGARCAGAALGASLARRGVRTLILEASPRGTDMPMSTHYMQPPGMAALDRLGIGERVREVTPPTRALRLALDDVALTAPLRSGAYSYCVRRSTLDPWLQDAAEAAGAELRDRHRVVDLVRDADRVTGVVVEHAGGRDTLTARLVVGADGPHSTVAKHAGVEEYLTVDGTRGGYFMYFPEPPSWEYPWEAMVEHTGSELRYVFRADGGLVLLAAVTTKEDAMRWGAQWRERTRDFLARSPITRALSEGREPVGKGCGLVTMRFFYRKPIGPGFALLGDAGHFKDFVTGQGMTDALLDAERLTEAIVDGREAAFERFWFERDVSTLPLHFDAVRQGRVGYNNPFTRWVMGHIRERSDLTQRLPLLNEREVTPYDLIPMGSMLRWLAGAAAGGRFDVLKGFLAAGKPRSEELKFIAARQSLLAQAESKLSGSL